MTKTKKQETLNEKIVVNTDEDKGPLDGASATVNMVKTVFTTGKDEGNADLKQHRTTAKIMASYELGVCSITADDVMYTVRIDEMMQVMLASANAYKQMINNSKKS